MSEFGAIAQAPHTMENDSVQINEAGYTAEFTKVPARTTQLWLFGVPARRILHSAK
jgi:hypothetical protein